MRKGRIEKVWWCGVAWLMAVAGIVAADTEPKSAEAFRWGGDLRLRQEAMDHIKSPSKVVDDNYLRMRTRVWGEWDVVPHLTARIRFLNEFLHWFHPDQSGAADSANYEWPDEVVIDNLYMDLRDLWEKTLSIRVGRQDFLKDGTDKPLYGRGKVIYDGTGEDGSRSRYLNAVRVSWVLEKNSSLDIFGIYMPPEDELALNSTERDLPGYTSAYDDMTQTGAGLYLKNKSIPEWPFEAYVIYKHDDDWTQAAKTNATGAWIQPKLAWQTLNAPAKKVENAERDLYTVGLFLAPSFGKVMRGSLEGAFQFGERGDAEIGAYMVDAVLCRDLPVWESGEPSILLEVYHLSGDDSSTSRDEGWDPVWARYTQDSDLLVRTYTRARWTNLTMPKVCLSASPIKKVRTTFSASYLTVPEADGDGGGRERGWWYAARVDYAAAENCLCGKDKLNTRVLLEMLDPGDYYAANDTAYFFQWQVVYKF